MARVLVIDDDEEIRTLVKHTLIGAGHEVEEALDGAEGLRLFGKRPPGSDGHDVITAIRVLHAEAPIIAVSGGGAIAQDELLLKAFEFRQLVGAVERVLVP
jgi:DNA-binding response OmpR family regulator